MKVSTKFRCNFHNVWKRRRSSSLLKLHTSIFTLNDLKILSGKIFIDGWISLLYVQRNSVDTFSELGSDSFLILVLLI